MEPFVWAKRVAWTVRTGQTCKAGVGGATMLADIFGFFAALIQGVQPLVRARWVPWTVGGGKAGDAGVFSSTILTVVVHGFMLFGVNSLSRLCCLVVNFAVHPPVLECKINDQFFSLRNLRLAPTALPNGLYDCLL